MRCNSIALFALERAAHRAVVTAEVGGDLVKAVAMHAVRSCDRRSLGRKDFRERAAKRLQLDARHLRQHVVAAELQREELLATDALAYNGRIVESRGHEGAVAGLCQATG